jgi:hypothetical protein
MVIHIAQYSWGAESNNFKANVAGYDAASISGLNETTSRLEYGKHIMGIMNSQPQTSYHMLKLGQVDLEFILYHKIYYKKEIFTFEEFCNKLIDKYKQFIQKIMEINPNIIIASINLPAYRDGIDIRDYIKKTISNGDDSVDMSLLDEIDPILGDFSLERMMLNFSYFNDALCNLAKELNVPFFDPNEEFIDKSSSLLKDEFRSDGHHYKEYSDPISHTTKFTHCVFRDFFDELSLNHI